MRGARIETGGIFSYLSPEQREPVDHPLRSIRAIVDRSLAELDGHFNQSYSGLGRPSYRLSTCFGRCCCRRSTAFAPSGG